MSAVKRWRLSVPEDGYRFGLPMDVVLASDYDALAARLARAEAAIREHNERCGEGGGIGDHYSDWVAIDYEPDKGG